MKALVGATVRPPTPDQRQADPWGVLLGALLGALVALALVLFLERPKPAAVIDATATAAGSTPTTPRYRPPMDVSRWPTAEAYLAEVGHLPPPPPGYHASQAEPPRIGLDASSARNHRPEGNP